MSRADAKGVACRQGAQGKHRASGGEARELYQGGHVVEMKMKGGTMRRVNMEKREGGRDERGGREGAWEGWRQTSNGKCIITCTSRSQALERLRAWGAVCRRVSESENEGSK